MVRLGLSLLGYLRYGIFRRHAVVGGELATGDGARLAGEADTATISQCNDDQVGADFHNGGGWQHFKLPIRMVTDGGEHSTD